MTNVPMLIRSMLVCMLFILILTGCGDQRILEKLGFVQAISFDLAENGQLEVAITMPEADQNANEKRKVLTATARTGKEARVKLTRESNLQLVSGQLRNSLFGMPLARKGLMKHLDTYQRDPSISPRVKLSIVRGNARSMLERQYPQQPIISRYIEGLLQKEATGQNIPDSTLYTFIRDYFDDGIDPVMPVLRVKGDNIVIDGIGLFRDDKYITEIPADDGMVFSFLRGSFKLGELSIHLSEGESGGDTVMVTSLVSKRKVKVRRSSDGTPDITIHVRLKGTVIEYTGGLSLDHPAAKHKLEKQIEKELVKRANRMIAFTQKNKTDSFGIGISVRNRTSYGAWKQMKWPETYPTVKVKCAFKFEIMNAGKVVQ